MASGAHKGHVPQKCRCGKHLKAADSLKQGECGTCARVRREKMEPNKCKDCGGDMEIIACGFLSPQIDEETGEVYEEQYDIDECPACEAKKPKITYTKEQIDAMKKTSRGDTHGEETVHP